MKKFILWLLVGGSISTVVYAASSLVDVRGITTNSSSSWVAVNPGLYVVELYAPDAGAASDPCGVAGGAWDTSNATVEYSPDYGVTTTNVDVAALVAATADVSTTMQVGRGYQFRVTVASVGASTCINYKLAKSQG